MCQPPLNNHGKSNKMDPVKYAQFSVVGVYRDGGHGIPHDVAATDEAAAVEKIASFTKYVKCDDGLYRSADTDPEPFGWKVSAR